MKVLVLSCNTGGGHNACAKHIKDEFNFNNIKCDFKNYFEIVNYSKKDFTGKIFPAVVGKNGGSFKYIYKLGVAYNKTKVKSPVYLVSKIHSKKLYKYIKEKGYDLVICPHLFPGLAMTAINKKHKVNFVFVATDYEYHPFTNEIKADFFIVPKGSEERFISKGIDKNKLVSLGIPISTNYVLNAKKLKHNNNKKNVLILLGSMGNGSVEDILEDILAINNLDVTIVCGNNKKLYNRLLKNKFSNLNVFGYCKNVNDLINSSDVVISKPGGLSTTEVAVFRKGLIHAFPVSGLESTNIKYFTDNGLSISAKNKKEILDALNLLLNDRDVYKNMIKNQEKYISSSSAKDLVDFIKEKYQ